MVPLTVMHRRYLRQLRPAPFRLVRVGCCRGRDFFSAGMAADGNPAVALGLGDHGGEVVLAAVAKGGASATPTIRSSVHAKYGEGNCVVVSESRIPFGYKFSLSNRAFNGV